MPFLLVIWSICGKYDQVHLYIACVRWYTTCTHMSMHKKERGDFQPVAAECSLSMQRSWLQSSKVGLDQVKTIVVHSRKCPTRSYYTWLMLTELPYAMQEAAAKEQAEEAAVIWRCWLYCYFLYRIMCIWVNVWEGVIQCGDKTKL